MKLRSLPTATLLAFVGLAGLAACKTVTTPTPAPEGIDIRSWDLFYRTAASDLNCDEYDLEVERVGGYTFSAQGCGNEIYYGVFFENATGAVVLSDLTVRLKAPEIVGECDDDPPTVYYYDDYHRNVHGCGKKVIVVWHEGGWAVDRNTEAPF